MDHQHWFCDKVCDIIISRGDRGNRRDLIHGAGDPPLRRGGEHGRAVFELWGLRSKRAPRLVWVINITAL